MSFLEEMSKLVHVLRYTSDTTEVDPENSERGLGVRPETRNSGKEGGGHVCLIKCIKCIQNCQQKGAACTIGPFSKTALAQGHKPNLLFYVS